MQPYFKYFLIAGVALPIFGTHAAVTDKILHTFGGSGDGFDPVGRVILLNGKLYGVTYTDSGNSLGIIYSFNIQHKAYKVEYTLSPTAMGTNPLDGAHPIDSLVAVGSNLWGVTKQGTPTAPPGTVFELTPSSGTTNAVYTVWHSFGAAGDGAYPLGGLTNINGVLYGTTSQGGANNLGTVFSIDTNNNNSYQLLYSFQGGSTDGAGPNAVMTNVNGLLYGVTSGGGNLTACNLGCGTIYSISPSGTENLVWALDKNPYFAPGGNLFTMHGAVSNVPVLGVSSLIGVASNNANGGVYALDLSSGTDSAAYNFSGGSDGASPEGPLELQPTVGIPPAPIYFGTASGGGAFGNGTVYQLVFQAGGTIETPLYSFKGGALDGAMPQEGVTAVLSGSNLILYGVTTSGGSSGLNSPGVLYSITNP